jgi:hypothetical protein
MSMVQIAEDYINDPTDKDLEKFVELHGNIRWRTYREVDGVQHTVDAYSGKNKVLLQIRNPILKLLGMYNNVALKYNFNNTGWANVPDTNKIYIPSSPSEGLIELQIDTNSLPYINRIAFGSDGTPATNKDTGLIAPIETPELAERTLASNPGFSTDGLMATFTVLIGPHELNGVEMREAVLKTTSGVAVARAPIGYTRKEEGLFYEFSWTIGYLNT